MTNNRQLKFIIVTSLLLKPQLLRSYLTNLVMEMGTYYTDTHPQPQTCNGSLNKTVIVELNRLASSKVIST